MSRLILQIVEQIGGTVLDSAPIDVAEFVILICAITIGHMERKPMTAAKLAQYVGMARPTVVRKLKLLHERRFIDLTDDGRAMLVPEGANSASVLDSIGTTTRLVQRAAADLSKLDSKPIAARESD